MLVLSQEGSFIQQVPNLLLCMHACALTTVQILLYSIRTIYSRLIRLYWAAPTGSPPHRFLCSNAGSITMCTMYIDNV
jgi:hypothetical protein